MLLKTEKFLFFVLIFCIPFQTRSFLFGPHSPITEPDKFVEWNSAFFYLTDLILISVLGLALFRLISCGKYTLNPLKPIKWPLIFLSVFVAFAGFSLSNAELLDYGVYRFLKLLSFVLFFLYIATTVSFGFKKDKKNNYRKISFKWAAGIFLASGVFQAVISLLQFARQESLGLTKLHESPLKIGMREVAQIKVVLEPVSFLKPLGEYIGMIRAYGTFPSPNILAGFLGLCILLLLYILISERISSNETQTKQSVSYGKKVKWISRKLEEHRNLAGVAVMFAVSQGFILAFSRGASFFLCVSVGLFFTGILVFKRLKNSRSAAIKSCAAVFVIWVIIFSLNFPEISSRFMASSVSEDSIEERAVYNRAGIEAVSREAKSVILGVGLGNFVNDYMLNSAGLKLHLYQPVHNVYLLVASEIGIIGVFAFVLFLISLIWKGLMGAINGEKYNDNGRILIIHALLVSVFFMCLIGLYDHYFWTIQQGALMFWVFFGFLAGALRESQSE